MSVEKPQGSLGMWKRFLPGKHESTIEELQERLGMWNRFLLLILGASAALLAVSLAETMQASSALRVQYYKIFYSPSVVLPAWYVVWLILQITAVFPAVVLTFGAHWKRISMVERLDAIFGSLAAAWMTLVSMGLKLPLLIDISEPQLAIILLGIGAVLGIVYRYLRNRYRQAPEELFP